MIAFPPFAPDLGPHDSRACSVAINVIPSLNGWKGTAAATVFSDALSGTELGGISVADTSSVWHTFVATDAGTIEELGATGTWTTRASGLLGPASGDRFQFVLFGNYVVALNGQDPNKYIDLANVAAGFVDLPGSPPKAKYGWVAADRLVLGGIENEPRQTRWCAVNDIGAWTIGYGGADTQTFADGGSVKGGVGLGQSAIVFLEDKIVRQNYIGGQYLFSFDDANLERGSIAPYSIVLADNRIFYLSRQGFFQGVEGQQIGFEKVNGYFLERVVKSRLGEVQGAHDPTQAMIWWQYPVTGGSEIIGYHYLLDKWTTLSQSVTGLLPVATVGMTLGDIAAEYPTLAEVPFPFGSNVWRGGEPTFAGFDSSNRMVFFNGSNAQATVTTNLFKVSNADRAFMSGFEVMTDAASFTGRVGGADTHFGAVGYTASHDATVRGFVPTRKDARLHKVEVIIPTGQSWTYISGFEPKLRKTGRIQ